MVNNSLLINSNQAQYLLSNKERNHRSNLNQVLSNNKL